MRMSKEFRRYSLERLRSVHFSRVWAGLLGLALLLASLDHATADTLKIVVPFAAGSSSDTAGRVIAAWPQLSKLNPLWLIAGLRPTWPGLRARLPCNAWSYARRSGSR